LYHFRYNFGPILYHFRDKARHSSKIAIFLYHLHSTLPLGCLRQNDAVSFGTKVNWNGVATLRWKKLENVFTRFDTIHELDRRTDTARPLLCTAVCGKTGEIVPQFGRYTLMFVIMVQSCSHCCMTYFGSSLCCAHFSHPTMGICSPCRHGITWFTNLALFVVLVWRWTAASLLAVWYSRV